MNALDINTKFTIANPKNSSLDSDEIQNKYHKLKVNVLVFNESRFSKNSLQKLNSNNYGGVIILVHPRDVSKHFHLLKNARKIFDLPILTYNNIDGLQKLTFKTFLKLLPRYLFETSFLNNLAAFRKIYYFGFKYHCPICNSKLRKFEPFGSRKPPRPHAQCPVCKSVERQRLTWMYLKNHTDLFSEKNSLLHFAPRSSIYEKLKAKKSIKYYPVDITDRNANIQLDIQRLPFNDNSFDYIWCSHVLEHVKNDQQALGELNRVLKVDGKAIILIPLQAEKTEEFTHLSSRKARLEKTGHPEHLRNYGPDFKKRLMDAGFNVKILEANELFQEHLLKKTNCNKKENIFLCSK